MYRGIIIEESLANKDILKRCHVLETNIEKATAKHMTPWVKQWTLHTVEFPEADAPSIAKELSESIDTSHKSAWYGDFKSDTTHYIVFPGKVFVVDRSKPQEYAAVKAYGLSKGIPEYQLDFSPDVR